MVREMTLIAAAAIALVSSGASYAQSPYGNPAASGVGGVAAMQGNTASSGTEDSRTMGGNPAEYDTSLENGAGLGETVASPHGSNPASAGAGRVGSTGR